MRLEFIMIFFFPEGRLGNQIFQYLALKKIAKKGELAVVFGFDELNEVFQLDGIIRVPRRGKVPKLLSVFMYRFFRFAGIVKLINVAYVEKERVSNGYLREGNKLGYSKGLVFAVSLIEKCTFHSEAFFNSDDVERLILKPDLREVAKNRLDKIGDNKMKVFIHLRFGDYQYFKVYGKHPLLPMKYFRWCIAQISNKVNADFLVFSDDPEKAKKLLGDLDRLIFLEGESFEVDFSMMLQCDGAILSASSFGWWAAYMLVNKDLIYAPKHWLGFVSSIDYPKQPSPEFFRKVDVESIGS